MAKIRVLIVEDSLLAQQMLEELITSDPEIEVVGTAANGKEGVEKTLELRPDLVTMDLNMPVMNGQEAIDQIMATSARPILVISSNNDAKVAFDACSRGALEVFSKDDLDPDHASRLTQKIKLLSKIRVIGHIRPKARESRVAPGHSDQQKLIAIACSTGGPKALSILLPELPADFQHSIVIAQHIEDGFTAGLIEWLNQVSPIPVVEGQPGMPLQGGTIYVSPAERHMKINGKGEIGFLERVQSDVYSPNCDLLLSTAAQSYGHDCVGVILTGMATDGVKGMQEIRNHGGRTLAQDESTSVVFGMNRSAIESGCIDRVLSIQEIGKALATI